jgi:PBP1b-binding outer membrane lipoprotein LpoB
MKMKSQFAIAGLMFAGLLASGCSQQQAAGSQQLTGQQTQAAEPAPAPAPAVVAPAPRPMQPAPVMPKVKAKGKYKGPIAVNPAMKQYQK